MDAKAAVRLAALLFITGVALSALAPPATPAEPYPTRAVTIIVPYSAGGRGDLTARILAQYMRKPLGQPLVVVDKPGASSMLGSLDVANAKPDGYTLLVGSNGLISAPHMVEAPLTYRDFAPIGRVTYDPAVLVINPAKVKAANLREFIAHARAHPGEVTVAMVPGLTSELNAVGFAKVAGIELRYIPYKGSGDMVVALAGGHADAIFDVPVIVKTMVQAGKAKILGIAAASRFAPMKEIETWKEAGVDLVLGGWVGLVAPKKTPDHVVQALVRALEATAKDPDFLRALAGADTYLGYLGPEELTRFLAAEDELTRRMSEGLGVKRGKN